MYAVPSTCRVNRTRGERGVCGMTDELTVARAALHMWEEPYIRGKRVGDCNFHRMSASIVGYGQNAGNIM